MEFQIIVETISSSVLLYVNRDHRTIRDQDGHLDFHTAAEL